MKTYGKLPIKMLKKTDPLVRCDVNIRENSTVIRKMVTEPVNGGQRLVSIKLSGDLEVSDKTTLRAFYDQQINKPKVSTSFATTNISSGCVALQFNHDLPNRGEQIGGGCTFVGEHSRQPEVHQGARMGASKVTWP